MSTNKVQRPVAVSGAREVTVVLTEEDLRKIVELHLLNEAELGDPIKLYSVARKSLDAALKLPDLPWRDWDEWGKGLTQSSLVPLVVPFVCRLLAGPKPTSLIVGRYVG